MNRYNRRVVIVIKAADQAAANEAALAFDPSGGGLTFTQGLAPEGETEPSHYWCCAALRDSVFEPVAALMKARFPEARLREWPLTEESDAPGAWLEELGLRPV